MNYGLYLASSGLSVSMARQDVLSNNLANVQTTAFSPDIFSVRQREVARLEDNLQFLDSNALLERLGGGVQPLPTRPSVRPSALEKTDNPLDVAIEGEGFFVVRTSPGSAGDRLTRDGRMTLDGAGRLVTAADGHEVQSRNGGPIYLDPSLAVQIRQDGVILQDGSPVDSLRLMRVQDDVTLVKDGGNLFQMPATGARNGEAVVRQGMLETSGVDPIDAMMDVTSASNAAQANARMITIFDELMGRAIGTLGRTG